MTRRAGNTQAQVNAAVNSMIAEHGFKTAIPWLLETLATMADISLSAPDCKKRERQFEQWSKAVTTAIERERSFDRPFAERISSEDLIRARGMGIML